MIVLQCDKRTCMVGVGKTYACSPFHFETVTRIYRRDKRKYSKIDKRAKDQLVRSPRENGGG